MRRSAQTSVRRLAGCSYSWKLKRCRDVLDCRWGLRPTFEVTHQAVGHVLVEILDALGQLFCAQVLKGRQVGHSSPFLQTINRWFLSRPTDLLAWHAYEESSAVFVDLPARFLEVLQEFHKVLGHLVCFKAGVATDGRTGGPSLWGLWQKQEAHPSVSSHQIYIKPETILYTRGLDGLSVRTPFFGGVRDDGLKNFLTVVTFRIFSLVFFSSNLEKGPREAWLGCRCGAAAGWECACVCGPWLLAYAASSSRCNLKFTYYQADAFD